MCVKIGKQPVSLKVEVETAADWYKGSEDASTNNVEMHDIMAGVEFKDKTGAGRRSPMTNRAKSDQSLYNTRRNKISAANAAPGNADESPIAHRFQDWAELATKSILDMSVLVGDHSWQMQHSTGRSDCLQTLFTEIYRLMQAGVKEEKIGGTET